MDRTTPWRSLLNTIVTTHLGMCITEGHHCVPLWTRTLSHVWALLASVLSQLFAFLWRMSKFWICIEHSAASTMSQDGARAFVWRKFNQVVHRPCVHGVWMWILRRIDHVCTCQMDEGSVPMYYKTTKTTTATATSCTEAIHSVAL